MTYSAQCIGPSKTVGKLGLFGRSVRFTGHGSWDIDLA
jgi:hypothetical protein